jgi:hypothetical protein
MIDKVLYFLRSELVNKLALADNLVSVGHLHGLSSSELNPGLRMSLVNLTQENTMRNMAHTKRDASGRSQYIPVPVHLNLFVMFAFDFGDYETDMIRLSQTLEFFQDKAFFDANSQPTDRPFPNDLSRLTLDLHSLEIEKLNHLWGMLGGTYFPSLLYQVRLVKIDAKTTTDAPEVTTLMINSELKS